ncbi:uncharacterized protein LOC123690340 [Pieris rapae]|uniref:uncharacterized protein LOC123690340 n=1 Tax=Pieris rapae TaxID=64459 RepID=UPI001E281891|nr:uncharacterized protein LOC123690340 [Pieris rapae]
MDAKIIISTLLLICVHLSKQLPQMQATTQTSVTKPENGTEGLSCLTGKEDDGICIKRNFCDYGTPAIDFSLYYKHGYKSVCSKDEVCCPQLSIIQHTEPKQPDDSFSNEDDDDIY